MCVHVHRKLKILAFFGLQNFVSGIFCMWVCVPDRAAAQLGGNIAPSTPLKQRIPPDPGAMHRLDILLIVNNNNNNLYMLNSYCTLSIITKSDLKCNSLHRTANGNPWPKMSQRERMSNISGSGRVMSAWVTSKLLYSVA